ncbi:MAG TPA: DUF1573 domain-containing protein [Anaerolineae bacterium]|nr:DUF1573 domain-containing protein [Anaerolineae bacterium]
MKRKRTHSALGLTALLALTLAAITGCTSVAGSPERLEPGATEAASEVQTDEGLATVPGRVELSTADFDFGTIPNTEPVSRVFQVRNAGEGNLEISGLSTSCGCTSAEIANRSLRPGEATDLTVTYDPGAHDGATGEFMRVVYVRTNDPDTPEARLTIHVTVAAS